MTLDLELIGIAVTIGAHWLHNMRRSGKIEAKVDRVELTLETLQKRQQEQGERLSRIEGRLNGSM